MHGNAWQWCADWYDESYYAKSPVTDPSGPTTGSGRVLRGSSWYIYARLCRSAYRIRNALGGRSEGNGFRVAVVRSGS